MRAAGTRRRRSTAVVLGFLGVLLLVLLTSRRDGPQPRESREDDSEPLSNRYRNVLLPPSDPKYASTKTLILVPGHGVFKGLDAQNGWSKEENWGLEAFQKNHEGFLIRSFGVHIKRSLEILRDRGVEESLVIFSGGQTKQVGPKSEGQSYYLIAEANRLFGVFPSTTDEVLRSRLFAEEFARDSYENVLFSICRFREVTGHYPSNIVVVNWAYKRERFEEYHRVAVRWHKASFEYIGIDMGDAAAALGETLPPSMLGFTDAGTLERVKKDLYLCRANEQTRIERNPQRRVIPYLLSCKDIEGLLLHCGPDLYDESLLPWGTVV